ncbi:unnamed protein product [Calypogeia fissa]
MTSLTGSESEDWTFPSIHTPSSSDSQASCSQEDPFPEEMILGNPNIMAEGCFGKGLKGQGGGWDVGVFDEVIKEYVAQLGNRESVHGMCEDYRAGATVDLGEQ